MGNQLTSSKVSDLGHSLLIVNLLPILMASSSSSKRGRSCDVFLNFRGPDVRNNFVAHLYEALVQIGINTYMDSEEMEKGEKITPALMKAIEESQIAIVVFSKNYASSSFCLDELAKIREREERKELTVYPVFYEVEPREVRTPSKGIYKEAMATHEANPEKVQKVKRWKEALSEAGGVNGWHFTAGDNEAKLKQEIVQKISTLLDGPPLTVAKYPVGIESRVQKLETILKLQSKDDVLMVGLWGEGGVGKTTLAKAIYNAVDNQFQGSCLLEHVREESLVLLQEKLLSNVLRKKDISVPNDARGSKLIEKRLCEKKVLIILDDVDDICQLDALAGDCSWFGAGSRIIITTRNNGLLTSHGVTSDLWYKVEVLEDGEAHELFSEHACLGSQKKKISSDLVDRVLSYANGLPLALKVLGSLFCGRGEDKWESTLRMIAEEPPKGINDVLKVSYDGLENRKIKGIFLDIACFFKGQKRCYIEKVLNSCGFEMEIGVDLLIERSLISEENGTLQMHDLIQLMGVNIVKEECEECHPKKRSRLWLCDDVHKVLSTNAGTKAIVLKLPMPEKMDIGEDAFRKMKNLKLLILRNVDNSFEDPIYIPDELMCIEWPGSNLKFDRGPKELVRIDIRNSKIQVGPQQFEEFTKLKFINFSKCESVEKICARHCFPSLEELDLHGCTNLECLPDELPSENLRVLNLNGCSKLQRFPDIPNEIKGLQRLDLEGTAIVELPASIENFVSLEDMNLCGCEKLAIIPSSIYKLQNLKNLWLRGCSKLISFPRAEEDPSDPRTKRGFPKLQTLDLKGCKLSEVEFLENRSCFSSLEVLNLSGNNFTNLPKCEQLDKLIVLKVSGCQQLQEIHHIPGQLQQLRAKDCKSLSKIPSNIFNVDWVVFLHSCHALVPKFTMDDFIKPEQFGDGCDHTEIFLPGGGMPKWLLPNKEGYISFMASQNFYEKIIGLAFCVIFRGKEGQETSFQLQPFVNGRPANSLGSSFKVDSDHVWFVCADRWWWDSRTKPNDWSRFELIIRTSCLGIVKTCGFRLICEPLGSDLKDFFLQHNRSLDPTLLYEVEREDSQTRTMKESSNGDAALQERRYSEIDTAYRNVRPGGEMPEEFVLVEDDTICFTASQDLYDKFLGLALCVVFSVEDGKKEISFNIVPCVENQRRNALSGTLGSFDSNHMWIQYLKSNVLWGLLEGGVDFGEFDKSYLKFSLKLEVLGGTVKKLGYVIRCRQLEDELKDELKVVREENPLVNVASLCEDSPDRADFELHIWSRWSGHRVREYLRKCHLHIEEPEASDSETEESGSEEWSSDTD